MKTHFKLITFLVLTASVVIIPSCNEAVELAPVCYMLTSSNDGVLSTYEYNEDNQIISVKDDLVATYTYTDGVLTGCIYDNTTYTFLYGVTFGQPNRINKTKFGATAGYIVLKYGAANNLTEVESHDETGKIISVNYITYDDNSRVTSFKSDEWNTASEALETTVEITNITTDEMKNPFRTNFITRFTNLQNIVVYGVTNITGGNVSVGGSNYSLIGTHIYNDNGYPTTTTISVAGNQSVYNYTFNCK